MHLLEFMLNSVVRACVNVCGGSHLLSMDNGIHRKNGHFSYYATQCKRDVHTRSSHKRWQTLLCIQIAIIFTFIGRASVPSSFAHSVVRWHRFIHITRICCIPSPSTLLSHVADTFAIDDVLMQIACVFVVSSQVVGWRTPFPLSIDFVSFCRRYFSSFFFSVRSLLFICLTPYNPYIYTVTYIPNIYSHYTNIR